MVVPQDFIFLTRFFFREMGADKQLEKKKITAQITI